jgi:hypothetical protein
MKAIFLSDKDIRILKGIMVDIEKEYNGQPNIREKQSKDKRLKVLYRILFDDITTKRDDKDPNKITLDIEKVKAAEDGSITDSETIRQIALSRDKSLFKKINPHFQFAGLYPEIMTSFNIKPDKLNKND